MLVRSSALFLFAAALGFAQRPPLNGFDEFVKDQLAGEKVPGVSVAVVDKDGALLSRGYGSRDAGGRMSVTSKTIFPLASVTKSFTAIGIGTLVDQGKLDWDTPIRTWLPDFRMYDSYAAEHITVRDLLSHRSGLPRYEGVWIGGIFPQRETVRRLAFLEPSSGFRSVWQYSNLNYTVAAYLQGQVDGGVAWEESEKNRVIDPIGMRSTTFSIDALKRTGDYALPYADVGSGLVEVPFMNFNPVAGAGALNTNAADLSRFLQMLVGRGKFGNKSVISEKRLRDLISPNMVIPGPWKPDNPRLSQYTYGLGWFLTSYRGHSLAWHWGTAYGFSTMIAFLPDEGYAVAVLCNRGQSQLPDILTYNIFDRVLGLPVEDWAGRFRREAEEEKKSAQVPPPQPTAREASAKPSHPIADYAGTYHHEGFGTIIIQQQEESLVAIFNNYRIQLKPAGFDVFKAVHEDFNPLADQSLQFRLDVDGRIDALLWDVEANVPRGVFLRANAAPR